MKLLILLPIVLVASIIGAFNLYYNNYYKPLDTCAKQNNVYECGFVAVPKNVPAIDIGVLGDDE